ncbi:electron transport complex subunit RsxC [Christensenellaceae bacterium OttesenSCG-928-K19]|nr:electron transport complex subunit RsxC [Christensenellaceae bacterium OttesenSCG-928-K19]
MGLTFKGGVHPLHTIHEGKQFTAGSALTEMKAPPVVSIPMSQHVGAPAKPVVEVGQRVLMGQVIGEANGFVSVPVHSSVSGTVKEIKNIMNLNGKPVPAVIIENDGLDEKCFLPPLDYESADREQIIERIREAGNVGMGGAAFPTHVKLSPPPEKEINLLLINGAECEPFLTADHRMMLEYPEKIATGIKILMKALDVKKAIIGIEDNKPDAIRALEKAVDSHSIRVATLKTKYPQGSEKQLIDSITGRIVPSGGLPMDVGVVVVNVSTAAAVSDAFLLGEPLIRRAVTVTGAVNVPQNLMVRVGTSTEDVIEQAGGFSGEPLKIISGGPMMGLPVPDLSCVITRGYSGVLVLDKTYTKKERQSNCIKCGRCVDGCPIFLNPTNISAAATIEDFEKAEAYNAMDCMNCGSCSFSCPAKIPLAQNIKFAKEMIMVNRMKEKQKKQQENC